MKNIVLVFIFKFLVFSLSAKELGEKTERINERQVEKTKLFDESNFGMFIHWGLYSKLAGVWDQKTYYGIGEWIMNPRMAGIPVSEYIRIAKTFNPGEFNAKEIAQLAKEAGMKYIIITSKHHEGFAMFHSDVDSFNIVDATPFGRDPMQELSKACQELGLGFGFYYSHNQDWTAPGATNGPEYNIDGSTATFEDYFYKKCIPQVKEICTNYGDIDFIWFDTPGNIKKELVIELGELVRKLQPNAMLCSRIGYDLGDYETHGDMMIPTVNIDGLWETCDTNNDSWSYAWYDNNFKSPRVILQRLISTVGRGGTYLFNIGPNGDGVVPEIAVEFLQEAGKWINKYPQVIYNAGSSPWGHALPWGDVTTNGNSLYLSVFDWPLDGKLYLPGLKSTILQARILNDGKAKTIKFEKRNNCIVFNLPYKPADIPISVIEVKLDGKAATATVESEVSVMPNYQSKLPVELAIDVSNAKRKDIRWMEKFGEWKHVTQVSNWEDQGEVTWTVDVIEPGYYYVYLDYKGEGRLVWKLNSDEGVMVQNQQAATEKYVEYNMGILEFKSAGKHTITVSLVDGDPESSSLKSVTISPITL
ncbi:alpha-L-fucosidase [Puteibacter caeruleilacunae]|nr:alpha-L-fucosidase [Puteibacter caeruleilacunae]